VVDTFDSSALAPVRPTIARLRTLRCPRTSGRPLLLLHHWRGSIHRRRSECPFGTPCRTEHRSESWALPSLLRATPSATSVHLRGLPDCLRCFLRFLPTKAPSLHRSYPVSSVLRVSPSPHTARPSSRELPVDPDCDLRWGFPCCLWSPMSPLPRQVRWNRFAQYCSIVFGLPQMSVRSAPALSVSWPAQRSLDLLILSTGWSDPVPRAGLSSRCGPALFTAH